MACSELERMREISMTEHQWKELDNLNELLQVACASLAIDAYR